jgi:hypothetical protein
MFGAVDDQVAQVKEIAGSFPPGLLTWIVGAGAALVAVWIAVKWLKRSPRAKSPLPVDLDVDVLSLPTAGPPDAGPVLHYYGLPVRLAVLVIAPAGRVRELPPVDQMGDLFDAIVPGLSQVVASHQPLVRRWPSQLSVRGFAHQFFHHVRLPGQGGKGTPWNSAAGVFKVETQPMMAGFILRAAGPTSLSQTIVEQEVQWLDLLRIKN